MKRYDPRGMYPPLQMVSVPTGDWVLNIEAEYELSLLKDQITERDKTLLEQQARIEELHNALHLWEVAASNAEECELDEYAHYAIPMPLFCDAEEAVASTTFTHQIALEAAPKAERIKALEEASAICTKQC